MTHGENREIRVSQFDSRYFSVAVVEDGVVTYISDESLRETMEKYLESN